MLQRIPSFLLFVFAFLSFAHLFLYVSVVVFFSIRGFRSRALLLLAALLLSLSFVSAITLVRAHPNPFTEAFYILAALWTGLLINLVMACALIWVVFFAVRIGTRGVNMALVSAFFIVLACAYSSWGVWNAFHPQIKNIEVEIKGLPEEWKGRTVVQLSDVHLGVINRAGFLQNVVRQVNSLHPDAVFITGDLFDGMAAGLSSFVGPLNAIEAREGVFFVTGNHEVYLGLDKVYSVLSKTKIRVLDDEVAHLGGLQIVGVSYPVPGRKRDVVKEITSQKDFIRGMPSVLLYHVPASINDSGRDASEQRRKTYLSPVVDFTAAEELGIGLQLSGHTHSGQVFPFRLLTRRIYNGFDYGLNRLGDFYIYTTSGTGTWGPPMRTGNTPEIVAIRFK